MGLVPQVGKERCFSMLKAFVFPVQPLSSISGLKSRAQRKDNSSYCTEFPAVPKWIDKIIYKYSVLIGILITLQLQTYTHLAGKYLGLPFTSRTLDIDSQELLLQLQN